MSAPSENRPDLWLKRRLWDAHRFGVTPRGLTHKLGLGSEPKIMITSIPKAGTHMVERVLCLHPGLSRMISRTVMGGQAFQQKKLERLLSRQRPGQVICGHVHHTPEVAGMVRAHDVRVVFVIRDPRDVVVSAAHYILKLKRHHLHELALQLPKLEDRIRLKINGTDLADEPGIDKRLKVYAGWLEDADSVVRYEELVNSDEQINAMERMFSEVGLSYTPALIEEIAAKLVSPVSVTFRSGTSGGWQNTLDDELLALFNEKAGESTRLYGYA